MLRGPNIIAMVAVILILGVCAAVAGDQISIKFEKYTLPNGLDVILHEDHALPMATVNIRYHVGCRNETPGRTGFAHLFEHIMFQGTPHFEGEYLTILETIGGKVNGSTTQDRTNYWETVPGNYLELALAMESDRMAHLLDGLTEENLKNSRMW